MTNPNKTHVTMLVDRSASMGNSERKRAAAEEGVNAYFNILKKQPGDCTVLLIEYDAPGRHFSQFDTDWYRVVQDCPLNKVKKYHLDPRGNTALLDAMAQAISDTGERLAKLPESERPATVIFVTQTDGEENSSREVTQLAINEKIKHQEQTYNWTFVFLGMGPEAWAMSQRFTGTRMASHHSTRSADTDMAYGSTYSVVGQVTNSARRAGGQSVGGWSNDVDDDGNVVSNDPATATP